MDIIFLGTGDAFASGGKLNTSFLIQSSQGNFLVDCGFTGLTGLKRQGLSANDVDVVLISHLHGDHYAGLPSLIMEAGLVENRKKPLTVFGPPGIKKNTYKLLELLYPGSDALNTFPLKFIEFATGTRYEVAGADVLPVPVVHSEAALPHGLRISLEEYIVGYSGDTGWNKRIPDISSGTDVFICECNFFEKDVPGHMNYRLLKEKRGEMNTKRLLLVHTGSELLGHMEEVEEEVAKAGLKISL